MGIRHESAVIMDRGTTWEARKARKAWVKDHDRIARNEAADYCTKRAVLEGQTYI